MVPSTVLTDRLLAHGGGAAPSGGSRLRWASEWCRRVLDALRALSPESRDALLYGCSALFAGIISFAVSIPLYRQWGQMAVGPYALATVPDGPGGPTDGRPLAATGARPPEGGPGRRLPDRAPRGHRPPIGRRGRVAHRGGRIPARAARGDGRRAGRGAGRPWHGSLPAGGPRGPGPDPPARRPDLRALLPLSARDDPLRCPQRQHGRERPERRTDPVPRVHRARRARGPEPAPTARPMHVGAPSRS